MCNIALNGREEKLVCKFEQFSGARIKLFTVVLFLAFVDSIKNEKAHEKKSTTRNKSAKSPGQRKQYELPWVGRLRSHSAGDYSTAGGGRAHHTRARGPRRGNGRDVTMARSTQRGFHILSTKSRRQHVKRSPNAFLSLNVSLFSGADSMGHWGARAPHF